MKPHGVDQESCRQSDNVSSRSPFNAMHFDSVAVNYSDVGACWWFSNVIDADCKQAKGSGWLDSEFSGVAQMAFQSFHFIGFSENTTASREIGCRPNAAAFVAGIGRS